MRTAPIMPCRAQRAAKPVRLVAAVCIAVASSAACFEGFGSFGPARPPSDSALVSPGFGVRMSVGDTIQLGLIGTEGAAMWVPDTWTVTPSDAATIDSARRLVALRPGPLTVTAIGSGGAPSPNRSGRRSSAQMLVLADVVPVRIVTVAAGGGNEMCAILAGATHLMCWPGPLDGAYGLFPTANGGTGSRTIVAGMPGLRTITGGWGHKCGLDAEGAAWCWGANSTGALGTGDIESRARPTRVAGDHRWSRIAAGHATTCALERDATLWCWGDGGHPFFVDSSTAFFTQPQLMAGGTTFRDIDMTTTHICGVRGDSTVVCWGDGGGGGLGQRVSRSREPLVVPLASKVVSISTGTATCALAQGGAAICWGRNTDGELARSLGADSTFRPTPVGGVPAFVRIAAGGGLTCGLTGDGAVWCWGKRVVDEGLGTIVGAAALPTPARIPGHERFVGIAVGPGWSTGHGACGITEDGSLLCWGENGGGFVGDGTHLNRVRPRAVRPPDP